MRILLTTTSYQDTPGKHHDVLAASGFEVVRARGPLNEQAMLDLVTTNGGFDGLVNGDDRITARVIDAALPRLKVIAKYGIGLDSIDVKHATRKTIPVLFTPGVNHTSLPGESGVSSKPPALRVCTAPRPAITAYASVQAVCRWGLPPTSPSGPAVS